jgi:hypothetical protein
LRIWIRIQGFNYEKLKKSTDRKNFSTLKHENSFFLNIFVGHFGSPGSGTGSTTLSIGTERSIISRNPIGTLQGSVCFEKILEMGFFCF